MALQWRAEAVGCPRKYFLFVPQNFWRPFSISCQISGQFAPWVPPPVLHHAPVTTFCSSFFAICLHFLTKTGTLDTPQGGCPGPSAPPSARNCGTGSQTWTRVYGSLCCTKHRNWKINLCLGITHKALPQKCTDARRSSSVPHLKQPLPSADVLWMTPLKLFANTSDGTS